MNKYHNTKNLQNKESEELIDTRSSVDFPERGGSAYEEPKIEEPIKYSMCAGCKNCGAYYNES